MRKTSNSDVSVQYSNVLSAYVLAGPKCDQRFDPCAPFTLPQQTAQFAGLHRIGQRRRDQVPDALIVDINA